MIKNFVRQNLLFLLTSLVFLGVLIVTDFVLDKYYLKFGTLAMWALNMVLFVVYTRRIREKAKQCATCNLFVPLDHNTNAPIPHCCYQKPKDLR